MSGTLAIERLATTRGLLALALPMAAGLGVGFFLHFINRLFLGWHSPESLAASLPAGMLAWTLQCFFVTSAGYVSTFVAQHHAAGEHDEVGAMCWPALWLSLAAGVVSLALIPARHQLVALFAVQDPAVAASMASLLGWYLAETGPLVAMAVMSGFFAGLGRTMLVFLLSLAGCVVSILLNHWLIFGGAGVPSLGVTGAGLATLLTSLIFLVVWSALFLAPTVRRRFGTWRNRNRALWRLRHFCRFALPRGGSEVLEMLAFLVFCAAIARLPTESVSASNIAFSLYLLAMVPFVGLSQGVAIAVGQCLGAGRPDLARQVGWRAFTVAVPVLMLIAAVFVLYPQHLLAIYAPTFPDGDDVRRQSWEATLTQAQPVMWCLAAATFGDGLHWIFRMVVVGAGDTRWTLVAMVTTAIVTLSLPVWWLLRIADPALLAGWGITPLTASYLCFSVYSWTMVVVLFVRFQYGPWPTMSVRR